MRFSLWFGGRKVLPERKAGVPVSVMAGMQGAGGSAEARGYAGLSREGFLRNPVAHRSIRLIQEAAASIPLLFYEGADEVTDHPARALLARPNPRASGVDFLEALIGHLLIAGNAYVEPVLVEAQCRELYVIRPDRVSIRAGEGGWPEAFVISMADGGRRESPIRGTRGDILHLRLFNPLSDEEGVSPLSAAAGALSLANAATRWNRALLDNSARPSGALVYQPKEGGNLSPDQYERLKRELEEGYSGAVNAGRPLLLEGGLDWKVMALSPRDMDFTEARNGAARDIALSLGVPPMLIGIPGDNTYANYQEANRAFLRLTVLPMLTRLLASLANWLEPDVEKRFRIEPDLDRVSGLASERSELWNRLTAAPFLTDAEKREAVGYGPLEPTELS